MPRELQNDDNKYGYDEKGYDHSQRISLTDSEIIELESNLMDLLIAQGRKPLLDLIRSQSQLQKPLSDRFHFKNLPDFLQVSYPVRSSELDNL
jgi:hypothetical protein